MSKLERVDYGDSESGWGVVGLFTLIVAIGLIFAAAIYSQRPRQEVTSPSGTGVRQSMKEATAESSAPLTVSPADGAITAYDHYYPKETAETLPQGNRKVRAWWSIDKKVALASCTDKKGTQLVAMIDDKKRLHNGWNEAPGKISRPEVYAVKHDGQVDGTAGFELDGKPWVLQSSKGASILMADVLLQVPHAGDPQDIKLEEPNRVEIQLN